MPLLAKLPSKKIGLAILAIGFLLASAILGLFIFNLQSKEKKETLENPSSALSVPVKQNSGEITENINGTVQSKGEGYIVLKKDENEEKIFITEKSVVIFLTATKPVKTLAKEIGLKSLETIEIGDIITVSKFSKVDNNLVAELVAVFKKQ